MNDLISRAEVLAAASVKNNRGVIYAVRVSDIEAIEGRKPAPLGVGIWVRTDSKLFIHVFTCSKCKKEWLGRPTKYCPNCGARMR